MKGIPTGQVSWGLTFQSPALPSGCHLNLSITLLLLLQLCEDPASIGGAVSQPPLLPAPCNLPLAGLSLFLSSRMPTWPLVEQTQMPVGALEVHTMGTPVGLWLGQNH